MNNTKRRVSCPQLTKLTLILTLLLGWGNQAWGDSVTESFEYATDGETAIAINSGNKSLTNGWCVVGSGIYTGYSGTLRLQTGNARSGNCIYGTTSNTSWLVCPIQVSGNVSVWAKRMDTSGYLKVGIATKNNDEFSISNDNVQTTSFNSDDYKNKYSEISINLGNSPVYVAFLVNGGYLDDVTYIPYVDESDTPQPTGFSSSVTAYNSVDLSWTAGGSETEWQIKWNEGSDFTPASAGTLVDHDAITTNSYALSGLSGNTTYYAYVRAYINAGTQSEWTGPLSFKTYEQYPTPTGLTASDYANTGTQATLSWSNGAGTAASKWQIKYSTTSSFDPDSEGTMVGDDPVTTNPYTITGLTANTTYYASVRADYGSGNYSSWTDKISFTPIEVWEDFSNGIPSSWYVQGTSWRTNQTGFLNKAYVNTSSSNVLRTPRLYAVAGQTLSFDVVIGGTGSSYKIKAQYSTDRETWTDVAATDYTESGTKTFTAPATGYYWLQFTGFGSALDNFVGFGPADATHELALGTATIPTSGIQYGDYTASVVVKELGGSGETLTAKLYFDGEEVAEKTGVSIGANRDVNVSVTFIPTSITTGQAYLKIIYNEDVELTTTPQDVTISETNKVISEDETEVPTSLYLSSGDVLKVKYTPKNGWSTICMPFGLWNFMGDIFGTGWKLYELSSYSDGALNFTKATSTTVSTPFLVYAENADPTKSVYYLRGVSLLTSYWNSGYINKEVEDGTSGATATFKGTFAPISAPNMNGKYGITNESKLAKGNTSASIPGYRAYLEFSEGAPTARIITIDGDEVATDLDFVKMVDPEAKDVYTLSGQKVLKAGKGIYIVNGRKVVIK